MQPRRKVQRPSSYQAARKAIEALGWKPYIFHTWTLFYDYGAMTYNESDYVEGDTGKAHHTWCSYLVAVGALVCVGKRKCEITNKEAKVWDVSDTVPTRDPYTVRQERQRKRRKAKTEAGGESKTKKKQKQRARHVRWPKDDSPSVLLADQWPRAAHIQQAMADVYQKARIDEAIGTRWNQQTIDVVEFLMRWADRGCPLMDTFTASPAPSKGNGEARPSKGP